MNEVNTMKSTTHRIEETSKTKKSNTITLKIIGVVVITLVAVGAYNKCVAPNKSNEISQSELAVKTTENESDEISEVEADTVSEQPELFVINDGKGTYTSPFTEAVTKTSLDYDFANNRHSFMVITDTEPHNTSTTLFVTLLYGNSNEEIETFPVEFDEYASSLSGYYASKDLFESDITDRLNANIDDHSIIVMQLYLSESLSNSFEIECYTAYDEDTAAAILKEFSGYRPSWYDGATIKK